MCLWLSFSTRLLLFLSNHVDVLASEALIGRFIVPKLCALVEHGGSLDTIGAPPLQFRAFRLSVLSGLL